MSTEKKQNVQKRVLDALKNEFQPLTEADGESLTGGFASAAGANEADALDINVPCNETSNTSCNTVAGCGAKPASS
jgi:hypothetical protein